MTPDQRARRDWTNAEGQTLLNDVRAFRIRKGDVLLDEDWNPLGTVTHVSQFQGRVDVTVVGAERTVQFDRDHDYVAVLRKER